MKILKLLMVLIACLVPMGLFGAEEWLTDYPAAQAKAQAEKKMVLLDFTGSDWCGWCIKLKNEVFTQPEFESFAKENLVLVEVDFPRSKQLPAALKQANQELARKYQIQGYPTIILLDSTGNNLGQTGYQPGGPKVFIAALQKLAGNSLQGAAAASSTVPEPPPAPLFNGAPTAPPPEYKDLQLKGISGPKNRRLAIINNQTLGEGETANVKLGKGQVSVRCLEIRETSVIIALDGVRQQKELRLQGRL